MEQAHLVAEGTHRHDSVVQNLQALSVTASTITQTLWRPDQRARATWMAGRSGLVIDLDPRRLIKLVDDAGTAWRLER